MVAIDMSPNIPRSKGNQAMNFFRLREYNVGSIFKSHPENEAERLVPDLFLFFKKLYIR